MKTKIFHASKADRLDDPQRRIALPTSQVIKLLRIHSGGTIADIGAGTGYFTLPLAEATGSAGTVIAIDAQEEMLKRVHEKLKNSSMNSVRTVVASAEATGLEDNSCDLVFMAQIWHELDDRSCVMEECKRILKEGGLLAILDWRPDITPEQGPPTEHRITSHETIRELTACGFTTCMAENVGTYSWLVQAQI